MNRLFIIILILLSSSVFSYPIKDLSEDMVVACLKNLQVDDSALNGDKPSVICYKHPLYKWNVKWEKTKDGWGSLVIPVGSVWDVKQIRIKYKINSINNAQIQFRGRYNTRESYANDYIILTNGSMKDNCEMYLSPDLSMTECVFENQRWAPDNYGWMQAIGFSFTGEGPVDMDIFSIQLIDSKGSVFDLWSYDWSMRCFEFPPYIPEGKLSAPLGTVYMGTSPLEGACEEGQKRILRLKELIPNLGCDGCGYAPGLAFFKDFYLDNNIPAYYQFGGSQDIEPSVTENKGHLMSSMGFSRDVTPGTEGMHQSHHEFDWTNQKVKDAFKEAIKRCGLMGIPQFQFIDAVWNCAETNNFGYGSETIEAFRKDLCETDEGLDIGPYGKKSKNIKFHEFLKRSGGVEIEPKDIGISSWEEYIPCVCGFSSEEEYKYWEEKTKVPFDLKNYFLFIMLKHYEWLKLFNEVGAEGIKYGCDVVAMPNGSNWANANDMTGLFEISNCKVLIDETRFYHPQPVIYGYEELPAWNRLSNYYNKELRLICEVGIGGGANIYLHPLFSYIMNYALECQGHYGSMQTDWIGAYVNEDSNKECTEAWIDFLFKAWGYNDASSDNFYRLKGFDDVLRLTTPLGNMVELSQKSTFKDVFCENNFPFIQYNYREWEDINPKCKLLIVDTVNIPKETAENIVERAEKEKINLFLHSYVAGCESDGKNYTNMWYSDGNTINNPTLFKSIGVLSLKESVSFKGKIKNINIDYSGDYYNITNPNTKVLISFNDRALLSKISLKSYNVYYYHLDAGLSKDLDKYVLKTVYEDLGLFEEATDENSYVQRFENSLGEVCILFNKTSFRNYNGPPNKWAFFDIFEQGGFAKATFTPNIKENYILYDFLNEKIISANNMPNKPLTVEMSDLSANIYYLIPESKKDYIDTLKERKEKLNYWENYRLEKFYF
ncbi:MAG: hypothetical protein IJS60_10360 [Abditibacteriota bacterium]|nr:hypothetical protein [Abditibacteriota bacterium]